MKIILTSLFILFLIVCSYSCKKSKEPDGLQPDDPGLEKNISENTEAKDFGSNPLYDLFITGHTVDSTGEEWGYWKNGDWNTIADARSVSGVFADNNHIYICGDEVKTINGIGGYKAAYWVDGIVTLPETNSNSYSGTLSIVSYNGKVYTCGYETDQAAKITNGVIWENEKPVYTFPGIYLNDLRIINGDLVVTGSGADAAGKYYNYIYKNGVLLFKNPMFVDYLSLPGFDADGADWVIAGVAEDYYINGLRHNLTSRDIGYINAINITPAKKILLGGGVTAYDRNNPPSYYTTYAGLWRDGLFDRLESRYSSELKDVKSIDDMEYAAGNIYLIQTAYYFSSCLIALVNMSSSCFCRSGMSS